MGWRESLLRQVGLPLRLEDPVDEAGVTRGNPLASSLKRTDDRLRFIKARRGHVNAGILEQPAIQDRRDHRLYRLDAALGHHSPGFDRAMAGPESKSDRSGAAVLPHVLAGGGLPGAGRVSGVASSRAARCLTVAHRLPINSTTLRRRPPRGSDLVALTDAEARPATMRGFRSRSKPCSTT